MRSMHRWLTGGSVLLLLVVLGAPMAAQLPLQVGPRSQLRVHTTRDRERLKGSVHSYDADTLRLIPCGRCEPRSVALAEITRIEQYETIPGRRARNIWLGALVGGTAGTMMGAMAKVEPSEKCRQPRDFFSAIFCEAGKPPRGMLVASGASVGALTGALVGALLPNGTWRPIGTSP